MTRGARRKAKQGNCVVVGQREERLTNHQKLEDELFPGEGRCQFLYHFPPSLPLAELVSTALVVSLTVVKPCQHVPPPSQGVKALQIIGYI